jgi:hypothetical protein
MSIETLNTAARAAGYAMAPDEAALEAKLELETELMLEPHDEVPGLLADFAPLKTAASVGELVKGVFSSFGRGAPA